MSEEPTSLYHVAIEDPRYPVDAYVFVREALAYAADSMGLGQHDGESDTDLPGLAHLVRHERHLTGQQLCEAIRQYANCQFGYMAKVVLRNWGVHSTSCFGDIVYNMIQAGIMKKSSNDRREHFDDVYEFDDVFQTRFDICDSVAQRRL